MLGTAFLAIKLSFLAKDTPRILFEVFEIKVPGSCCNLVVFSVYAFTEIAERSHSRPSPALRNLEGDLVVDADRLALAALLIVAAIGSAVDGRLAALGGFELLLFDELRPFGMDALQQDGSRLVRRVLLDELSLDGQLQDGFAQAVGQLGVQALASFLQFFVAVNLVENS